MPYTNSSCSKARLCCPFACMFNSHKQLSFRIILTRFQSVPLLPLTWHPSAARPAMPRTVWPATRPTDVVTRRRAPKGSCPWGAPRPWRLPLAATPPPTPPPARMAWQPWALPATRLPALPPMPPVWPAACGVRPYSPFSQRISMTMSAVWQSCKAGHGMVWQPRVSSNHDHRCAPWFIFIFLHEHSSSSVRPLRSISRCCTGML